jgi:hypothetical protein
MYLSERGRLRSPIRFQDRAFFLLTLFSRQRFHLLEAPLKSGWPAEISLRDLQLQTMIRRWTWVAVAARNFHLIETGNIIYWQAESLAKL